MIDHLYDRGVRTIGPLCHANGIAWRRDRKRLQREVPSSLFSLSPFLSFSLPPSLSFSLVPFQRPHREHRLLARARPTTRVNLVCIWSGPVRLAGVQSMDVIHCSPTESQADGRTYVCMYVWMAEWEKGVERRGTEEEIRHDRRRRPQTGGAGTDISHSGTEPINCFSKIYSFARNILARSIFGYDGYGKSFGGFVVIVVRIWFFFSLSSCA